VDPWIALFDILALLATAALFGAVAERLGQSSLIGYLLAGVLLGPRVLHVFESQDEVAVAAELGVALLLFSIGLEFSWDRLRALGRGVLIAGALQVIVTAIVAAGVSALFPIGFGAAVVIGAATALSSTACVLRLLRDRAELDSVHGRDVLAILIIQDIAVIPLALLIDLMGGGGDQSPWLRLGQTLLLGGGLVLGLYVLLKYLVPLLLTTEGVRRNRELAVLLAIVVGLGSAWSAHAVGISPALGAFIAGLVLAGAPQATQVRADIASLRTLLLTLFFGSVGMLADPIAIARNFPALLLFVVFIVAGKALIITMLLQSFGRTRRSATGTGLCLAQTGEFSIVLLTMARGTVISDQVFMLIAGATIITLLLSPYAVMAGAAVARGSTDSGGTIDAATSDQEDERRVVVIGFGPAGRAVARSLMNGGKSITVIELNRKTAEHALNMQLPTIIGDASNTDVLEHAHISRACAAVIALPDPTAVERIAALIGQLAPKTQIAARVRYHRHRSAIESQGVACLVDEEETVGEELGRVLLATLDRDKAALPAQD
jgi:CPA2 family monovalent cation:H+ antiporter-2